MHITTIIGTDKDGVTSHLAHTFLESFFNAEKDIYTLPSDGPALCTGCMRCFDTGEQACPHADRVRRIENSLLMSDLIVIASPTYTLHTPDALTALLNHFAYRFMPHRPHPDMFRKRAVVITQAAGYGSKNVAREIAENLSWWGIPNVHRLTFHAMCLNLDESPKQKEILLGKTRNLGNKMAAVDYMKAPAIPVPTKIKFYMCRAIMKKRKKDDPENPDVRWWESCGFLEKGTPWHTAPDAAATSIHNPD